MSDAVVEMTAKSLGCVVITDRAGRLTGIITDGDLRRHMRADLLDAKVDTVMTRSPITVRPDQLASEAIEIINSAKITALFVVDDGHAVGIVHLHDLLRAGVA
jgi:arabinose-5-phosphate isomerase